MVKLRLSLKVGNRGILSYGDSDKSAVVDSSGQLLVTSLLIFMHCFDFFLSCLFVMCVTDERW